MKGESRHLILIILLTLVFVFMFFLAMPMVSEKATKASTKLEETERTAQELADINEALTIKMAAENSKKNDVAEKEASYQKKIDSLGIEVVDRYLESSNRNIFYLFSTIAKTVDLNLAELAVEDADVLVPTSDDVIDESTIKNLQDEDELDEELEEDLDAEDVENEDDEVVEGEEGEETPSQSFVPTGYTIENKKQVSVSMYGDYIDIMLYFQALDKLSDNFELVSLDVSPLVLADGVPVEDYELAPNDYTFVSGNTMKNLTKLDLFYYEDKLKENLRIAQERAQKAAEEYAEKEQSKNDKYTSLIKQYSIDKDKVKDLAIYYSKEHGVPVHYIMAVIDQESKFDATAVNINRNGTKDRGLMQLNQNTAKWLVGQLSFNYKYTEGMEHIPALNIDLGTKYLKSIADSIGFDFESPDKVKQHFVLSAYNRGVAGLEQYAAENRNYEITPYETNYSKSVIEKLDKYILVGEDKDIEVDYYEDIKKYEEAVALLNEDDYVDKDEEEPLKNYKEVTSAKALFYVKDTGKNTLLLEPATFKFDTKNTKESPFSGSNLSKVDTSNIGNNGVGPATGNSKLRDEEYRKKELERTKLVIRNRIVEGLDISKQLDYLKLIILYDM